ncbi:phage tail protein [Lysinibacillus sphaericus]|uniref:phage tail protein n=1 Tax=Lysinibacillus sphaericus TaxID=1421 RepID=UPI0018AD5CFD|nr:phage tail protein [Lysinibacillus sphaericus]
MTNFKGTQTEPFFTTSAPIFEQDTLGNLSLEFTVNKTNNEVGFNLLQEESVVTAAGYNFRVKQIYDDKPGRKTTLAISTFFDLSTVFKSSTLGGTHSIQEFLTYLFTGTGWTATFDFTGTETIGKFGIKNIIQCVNQICDAFDCEFEILPNNRVHFSKSLGPDNGAQYRYGHNIKALSRKVDTTHLRTKITATGKEGLTVTYTSPNHTIWGIREADPISDERFTDANNLTKKAKNSLIDYPEVSFELDTIELLDKQLGEKVWLIYEPIEGLELQTRILQRTCIVDELTDELKTIAVKLGNSLPRTLTDNEIDTEELIEETKEELSEVIEDNKKEFRSAITQTDSRITLEVEQLNKSIATIDVKADNISLTVNNRITNEMAAINIRADQIQSTVSAQGVQLHGVDTRVASAESSITQHAHQISQKVSTTDYNGNTISSLINQTASEVLIKASKIKFVGEIYALSDISGNLGTIHAGNINIQQQVSIGNRLNIQGSGGAIQFTESMASISSIVGSGLTIWDSSQVQLNASSIKFGSIFGGGNIDFGGLSSSNYSNITVGKANTLNGFSHYEFATAHTMGIGIAYSPASRLIWFRMNGVDVGSVKLT